MIKFEVKSRWSGAVKFTAEIDCDENASHSVKLGLAVKWGLKNDTDLRDTDLSGAVLSGAVLRDTDLRGADLRDTDLSGAVLRDTDLSGAVLSGAVLRDTDLSGAVLRGAVLSGADMRGADLRGAVLSGADMRGADLRGAVLSGADMRGADMRDTDLSGAVLSGAVLRDTDLRGAKFGNGTTSNITPLQIIGLTWDVIIFDNTMKIGCQWHSLHDWELFDDDTIKRMDVRNAPQFWATNKDWLLGFAKAHGRTFEPVEKA